MVVLRGGEHRSHGQEVSAGVPVLQGAGREYRLIFPLVSCHCLPLANPVKCIPTEQMDQPTGAVSMGRKLPGCRAGHRMDTSIGDANRE